MDPQALAPPAEETEAPAAPQPSAALAAMFATAAALAACGGGGSESSPPVAGPPPSPSPGPTPSPSPSPGPTPAPTPAPSIGAADAARFLSQAAFGATDTDVQQVQSLGYSGWIDAQFNAPTAQSHWDWMVANGYTDATYINSFAGVDATVWRKLISSPDALRQRTMLALSEIFVISMAGLPVPWRGMAVAAYADLLESNAFGNFRSLLEAVTLSCGMGVYLNMRGNQKEDPKSGRLPDENYAREVMQLLTIGLYQLNADGTVKSGSGGAPIETYTQDDISNVAKVLTGWDFNAPVAGVPDHMRRPMAFFASRHSTSAKSFLGMNIAAGSTDGAGELKQFLDLLFNHPNTAPFFSRQLIQRFVTSNPSPAYVGRVAAVFANNGSGVRGDLKAVIKAMLLDGEARSAPSSAAEGKLREPVVRFVQWARTFGARSAGGLWPIGDLSDPATRLGQSPFRSPSVFNFFRPGYVPPNTPIGNQGLVAPEFQITNESTVVGYTNFMQTVISGGRGDVAADPAPYLAAANDASALFDRFNVLLAGGQLGAATKATITTAVATIDASTDAGRTRRVQATALLVMAAPEYIVLK